MRATPSHAALLPLTLTFVTTPKDRGVTFFFSAPAAALGLEEKDADGTPAAAEAPAIDDDRRKDAAGTAGATALRPARLASDGAARTAAKDEVARARERGRGLAHANTAAEG